MSNSYCAYIAGPWTVERISSVMEQVGAWTVASTAPRRELRVPRIACAWISIADDDAVRFGREFCGFEPSAEVSFEGRIRSPDWMPVMVKALIAIAQEGATFALLMDSEDVLLRATGGRCAVPEDARDWWEETDLIGLLDGSPVDPV